MTCTFENTEEGSITIVKDALPDDPQDFGFSTTGGLSPATFSLDDDADGTLSNTRTFTGLLPGTYGVTEGADPPGWALTDLDCTGGGGNTSDAGQTATIGLDPGEAVTCTFENTEEGSITVVKDAVDDDPQDFGFSTTGGLSPATFSLDDDGVGSNQRVFTDLLPGTYTVAEDADPSGWQLTEIACLGGGGDTSDAGRTATIGLDPGETVTCTFENTQEGSITVVKDALPNDPQDFSYTTTGGLSPATFTLDDDADPTLSNTRTFTGLLPGTYTVAEDPDPAGWQLTDITCTGGGTNTSDTSRTATIGLDPGEAVTCTFTNTEEGSITIVKDALPNDPQDFSYTTTGLSPATFTLDDDADGALSNTRTFTGLLPGTYTVAEDADPPGWQLTDLSCVDPDTGTTWDLGTRTATIDLDAGEDIVCTF
ncbi:MAG: prealbumin-like fold domain-containing protein, partial [Actinomycetota bacterium]